MNIIWLTLGAILVIYGLLGLANLFISYLDSLTDI